MSNQPVKIDQKIVGYSVVKPEDKAEKTLPTDSQAGAVADPSTASSGTQAVSTAGTGPTQDSSSASTPANENSYEPTIMGEHVARPSVLTGTTYKIEKSPASEHAMYVTINDIVLDQGTEHEERLPFEIFINSKNMDQFQWVVAMTRIISAVFRKGGDVSFLAEEMKAVFDPKGGYFKAGGYVPSLVAEIGQIIEKHLQGLGLIDKPGLDPMAAALIAEKKQALANGGKAGPTSKAETKTKTDASTPGQEQHGEEELSFPPNATMCSKCNQKSVVVLDGCATCLNCGNSKCG